MSSSSRSVRRRLTRVVGAGVAVMLLVSACGSKSSSGGSSSASGGNGGGGSVGNFSLLMNSENTTVPKVLTALGSDACKTENAAQPFKSESVPQTTLDQKLQLLAGQNALPQMFAAGNAPALTKQLAQSGQILDLDKALTDLGVRDQVLPAAVSTIKALYGGFNTLPTQYNIEGIWYNKKLFSDNGITMPTTWDQLMAAADKLNGAGVQPFSASGEQGWPITRLISGYIFRSLGPDALKKVADKQAKLTDDGYVKAAQAVADIGKKGYFGKGVGSIDYDTAMSTFLSGKAGMLYMGSWALGNFADPKQDKIGATNIGFMPFPNVSGGAGSSDQTPANVGLPVSIGAKGYDANSTGKWLACIAKNYGQVSLAQQNTITGFKVNGDVKVDDLTKTVQTQITNTQTSVLWFEALFGTKATKDSQTNAAPLATGAITPANFMKLVQTDLDAGN